MSLDSNQKLTDEQQMLSDMVSKYLSETYDFDSRRKIANGPVSVAPPHWKKFAEMGWLAMPFDESDGGFNGGPKEISILFEAFGKHLVLEPYLETILLGGGALSFGPEDIRRRYLPAIIAGDLQCAFAHHEPNHTAERYYVGTTALQSKDSWQLNGVKSIVSNAPHSGLLVLTARIKGQKHDSDGIGLFVVDKNVRGVHCDDYLTIDGRRASEITLNEVEVERGALLSVDAGHLDTLLDRACFAVCAEAVGAMSALISMTIDYCQQRKQFGQSIGSFQALQHRMVDMYIASELSHSLLIATTNAIANASDDRHRLLAALKFRVDRSAREISYGAIQMHGGIAMTDEFKVGHYFKRLTVISKQFGNANFQLERYRHYNVHNNHS